MTRFHLQRCVRCTEQWSHLPLRACSAIAALCLLADLNEGPQTATLYPRFGNGARARRKIAAAQRAKWAKVKREKKRPDTDQSRAFSEQTRGQSTAEAPGISRPHLYRLHGLLLAANCELVRRPGRG